MYSIIHYTENQISQINNTDFCIIQIHDWRKKSKNIETSNEKISVLRWIHTIIETIFEFDDWLDEGKGQDRNWMWRSWMKVTYRWCDPQPVVVVGLPPWIWRGKSFKIRTPISPEWKLPTVFSFHCVNKCNYFSIVLCVIKNDNHLQCWSKGKKFIKSK